MCSQRGVERSSNDKIVHLTNSKPSRVLITLTAQQRLPTTITNSINNSNNSNNTVTPISSQPSSAACMQQTCSGPPTADTPSCRHRHTRGVPDVSQRQPPSLSQSALSPAPCSQPPPHAPCQPCWVYKTWSSSWAVEGCFKPNCYCTTHELRVFARKICSVCYHE